MLLTVDQALEKLNECGITNSEQVLRRWLRNGDLIGHAPGAHRKTGWTIDESDLNVFISKKKPEFALQQEIQRLRAENERLKQENEQLRQEATVVTNSTSNEEVSELKAELYRLNAMWGGVYDSGYRDRYRQADVIYKSVLEVIEKVLCEEKGVDRRSCLLAFIEVVKFEINTVKKQEKLDALQKILDKANRYLRITEEVNMKVFGSIYGKIYYHE